MSGLLAARMSDAVAHSCADAGISWGTLAGIVVGLVAAAFTIFTFGTGALVIGAAIATVGATGIGGALMGESLGATHDGDPCSAIKSGSPNVIVEGKSAARAGQDTVGHDAKLVASGSRKVLVNNAPFGRLSDAIQCGGKIVAACRKTIVGGDAVSVVDPSTIAHDGFSPSTRAILTSTAFALGAIALAPLGIGAVLVGTAAGFVFGTIGGELGGAAGAWTARNWGWFSGNEARGAAYGAAVGGLVAGGVAGAKGVKWGQAVEGRYLPGAHGEFGLPATATAPLPRHGAAPRVSEPRAVTEPTMQRTPEGSFREVDGSPPPTKTSNGNVEAVLPDGRSLGEFRRQPDGSYLFVQRRPPSGKSQGQSATRQDTSALEARQDNATNYGRLGKAVTQEGSLTTHQMSPDIYAVDIGIAASLGVAALAKAGSRALARSRAAKARASETQACTTCGGDAPVASAGPPPAATRVPAPIPDAAPTAPARAAHVETEPTARPTRAAGEGAEPTVVGDRSPDGAGNPRGAEPRRQDFATEKEFQDAFFDYHLSGIAEPMSPPTAPKALEPPPRVGNVEPIPPRAAPDAPNGPAIDAPSVPPRGPDLKIASPADKRGKYWQGPKELEPYEIAPIRREPTRVISEAEANTLAERIFDTGIMMDDPHRCYMRLDEMLRMSKKAGVEGDRIEVTAVGTNADGSPRLLAQSMGQYSWHVAQKVTVRGADGVERPMVIDPMLSSRPLEVSQWQGLAGRNSKVTSFPADDAHFAHRMAAQGDGPEFSSRREWFRDFPEDAPPGYFYRNPEDAPPGWFDKHPEDTPPNRALPRNRKDTEAASEEAADRLVRRGLTLEQAKELEARYGANAALRNPDPIIVWRSRVLAVAVKKLESGAPPRGRAVIAEAAAAGDACTTCGGVTPPAPTTPAATVRTGEAWAPPPGSVGAMRTLGRDGKPLPFETTLDPKSPTKGLGPWKRLSEEDGGYYHVSRGEGGSGDWMKKVPSTPEWRTDAYGRMSEYVHNSISDDWAGFLHVPKVTHVGKGTILQPRVEGRTTHAQNILEGGAFDGPEYTRMKTTANDWFEILNDGSLKRDDWRYVSDIETREVFRYHVDHNPGNFRFGHDDSVSNFDPIALEPVARFDLRQHADAPKGGGR